MDREGFVPFHINAEKGDFDGNAGGPVAGVPDCRI